MVNNLKSFFSIKIHAVFVLFAITVLVFISGCGTGSQSQITDFQAKGYTALKMNFLKETFPEAVYENYEFPIRIELRNEGSVDIVDGILNTVVDEDYLEFSDESERFKKFSLKGLTAYTPGDYSVETITLKSKGIDDFQQADAKITINACYQYKTIFDATVCIDTDTIGYSAEKACTMKPVYGSSGVGAPIVVESVTAKVTSGEEGVKVMFDIALKNSGKGDVIGFDSFNKICGEASATYSVSEDDLNAITVEDIQFSNYKMSEGNIVCTPPKFNIVTDRIIQCTTTEELSTSLGAFSTQFLVKLKYAYLESMTDNILIEKAGR